jgi:hypothetical protein
MTDDETGAPLHAFGLRLGQELLTASARALVPFDAAAIAREVVAARPGTARLMLGRWSLPRRALWLVLAAALLSGLLLAWAAVGQRPVSPLAFAPGSIAFTRGDALFVAGADGSQPAVLARSLPMGDAPIDHIAFAPDRRHVAFDMDDALVIATPDGRMVTANPAGKLAWSPTSDRLAAWSIFATRVSLVGLDGRVTSFALPEAFVASNDSVPAWSPDGRWIAVQGCVTCDAKSDAGLLLVSADRSATRWVDPTFGQDYAIAWSSDGHIAISRWDSHEVLITDDHGTVGRRIAGHAAESLGWSPDGSTLLIWEGGANPEALWLAGPDGTPRLIPQPFGETGPPTFSADGTELMFTATGAAATGGPAESGLWSMPIAGGAPRLLATDVSGFAVATTDDR